MSRGKIDIEYMKGYLSSLGDNISKEIESYQEEIKMYKGVIIDMQNKYDTVVSDNESKTGDIIRLNGQISSLTKEILRLQEDNAAFSKVSHIIAMEKENAKLRAEVDFLNKRIRQRSVKEEPKATINVIEEVRKDSQDATFKDVIKDVIKEVPIQEEEEETFYEKKIKGVTYYISEITSLIYKKNDDEEVGDKVGRLEKTAENKNKVIWD